MIFPINPLEFQALARSPKRQDSPVKESGESTVAVEPPVTAEDVAAEVEIETGSTVLVVSLLFIFSLSIYLSTNLSLHPSIFVSICIVCTYSSISLYRYPSIIFRFIYLLIDPSVYRSIHLSIYFSIYISIYRYLSIYPLIYLSIYPLSIYLSIYLLVYLSIDLCIYPSSIVKFTPYTDGR